MDLTQTLEGVRARVDARSASEVEPPGLRDALEESVAYLHSEQALRDLEIDPYWPKWTSPWWHLTLLDELGLAERIPSAFAARMAQVIDAHYLHDFPLRFQDVPEGKDPYRHILCHCALGISRRVLHHAGVDVDTALPWTRGWIRRYQLPDGGLNCDEAAYTRKTPHSSMVSTLPPAEALLFCTRELDAEEQECLGRVAEYLQARSLFRSRSKGGRAIFDAWRTPCFPRFYFYDVLRGLRFLALWGERCGGRVRGDAIAEATRSLDAWFETPDAAPRALADFGSYAPQPGGEWKRVESAGRFPLLDVAATPAVGRARLEREWLTVLEQLTRQGVQIPEA